MKHSRRLANSVVLVVLLLFASTQNAHAYVDPGTGSYIIQLIIAGLVGVAFAVRIYWGKIKALFSRPSGNGQETGDDKQ
jgi:hypothetical protein